MQTVRLHSLVALRPGSARPAGSPATTNSLGSVLPARHLQGRHSSSESRASKSSGAVTSTSSTTPKAQATVKRYYEAFNRGDIEAVIDCFADDVVYHDAIYLEPFIGKPAVAAYFKKFSGAEGIDQLKFVVTEYAGDEQSCGAAWHTEVDDGFMPFSRGCSMYVVNEEGKIKWGRDCVEASPPKPGNATIGALQALIPVIRKVGVKRADPAQLANAPFVSIGVWAFFAAYVGYILLSTSAPGNPAWNISGQTISELVNMSLNFFYVNIGLKAAGLDFLPGDAVHPVYEALFNFVGAWGLMFLPVMLRDKRSRKVKNLFAQWLGIWFVTNIFFIPYLAQRAAPEPHPSGLAAPARTAASLSAAGADEATASTDVTADRSPPLGDTGNELGARAAGAVGLIIGLVSVGWALVGRPEAGDLASRWSFYVDRFDTDRVFYAFVLDVGLYAFWQAWMMKDAQAPRKYCAIPFFGMVAWLLAGRPIEESS